MRISDWSSDVCSSDLSKNTETRHAAKPVTPRLSAAQIANDASHDSPSDCSSAVSTPITISQAEAPNTIATATQASARPLALTAMARSPETTRGTARQEPSADYYTSTGWKEKG